MLPQPPDRATVTQRQSVWAQFDTIMTNRALVRLGAAVGWTWLAAEEASSWWWLGTVMVLGSLTSLLHARRRLLNRLFSATGRNHPRLRRALEVAFPYPVQPHVVELPGYLETAGLLMMAVPSGWIVTTYSTPIFEDPAAASTATALVFLAASTYFSNLGAHPSYAMGSVPSAYRGAQAAAIAGSAAAGPLFLWPALDDPTLRHVTVIGSLLLFGTTLRSVISMGRLGREIRESNLSVEHIVLKDLRTDLHTGLKNPAGAMLNNIRAWERAATRLEDGRNSAMVDDQLVRLEEALIRASREVNHAAQVVAARSSAYVEATGHDSVNLTMTAEEAVVAVLRLYDSRIFDRLRDAVTESLDPRELPPKENERMANLLSEFLTNAIVANATSVEVRFRWAPLHLEGDAVELSLRCDCGKPIAEGRPAGGTLALLADRLEMIGGALEVVAESGGIHTTFARWPVDRISVP